MDLIIVRHAQPVRIEGADGPADPPLSELGRQQSEATADFLADEEVHHVVASPMLRAIETARPLAARLGLEVEVVAELAELDHESDTYIPVEEMKSEGGERWEMLSENPYLLLEEAGGEAAFRERVLRGFDGVISRNPGRSVVAFCHGGTTAALLNSLLGVANIWAIVPEYCGISRVTASRTGVRTVRSANETAHVRGLLPERL